MVNSLSLLARIGLIMGKTLPYRSRRRREIKKNRIQAMCKKMHIAFAIL